MSEPWRDTLMRLHVAGWNSDDIDDACEALAEACDDGAHAGTAIDALTPDQVRATVKEPLETRVAAALVTIADLRRQGTTAADELRTALYDLDAFAYEYAGDV